MSIEGSESESLQIETSVVHVVLPSTIFPSQWISGKPICCFFVCSLFKLVCLFVCLFACLFVCLFVCIYLLRFLQNLLPPLHRLHELQIMNVK